MVKSLGSPLVQVYDADYVTVPFAAEKGEDYSSVKAIPKLIEGLRKEMKRAAANLEFEKAAEIRDQINELQEKELGLKNLLVARGSED